MRESRSLGSVGAKAEWLSYPTTLAAGRRKGTFPRRSDAAPLPGISCREGTRRTSVKGWCILTFGLH